MRSIAALVLLALMSAANAASLSELHAAGEEVFGQVDRLRAAGIAVPPDALPTASLAVAANDNFSADELDSIDRSLQRLQQALAALETEPGLAGALTAADPPRPEVGTEVDLALVYRPARPLPEGAELIIDLHPAAPGEPQNVDPQARNHVALSAPSGQWVATVDIDRALAGSLAGERYRAAFQVSGEAVPAGTPISIDLARLEMPTRVYGQYPVGLRVRLEPDGYAFPVDPVTLSLLPGPLDRIAVFAPANVASDERVPVTIRVEDAFGNLVEGRVPPFDVLVDGNFETRTAAADDPTPVVELPPLALGTHTVEVRSAGGGLRAETRVRASAVPERIRWIDPHVNSSVSGALPTEPEIRRRQLGRLDTVQIKEMDTYLGNARWQSLPVAGIDGFVRSANIRAGGQALVLTNGPMRRDQAPRLRFPSGASLTGLPEDALVAALPEVPMDIRLRNPQQVRLVEVLSGAASHEWYGQQLAEQGSRIGFIASATAHDRGADATLGARTAVRLRPGESTFSALAAARTWVTSGPAIVLDVSTNGAAPGERAAASVNRTIRGEVRGTAPIDRIELVRNGEVVAVRDLGHAPDSDTVMVSLMSDSAPFTPRDLPRNGREWIGFLRLQGGEITGVDDGNLGSLPGQAAVRNPSSASRADFIAWTRGRATSFFVDIALAKTDDNEGLEASESQPAAGIGTAFEVVLRRGLEDQRFSPLYREAAEIPPATLVIGMNELLSGPVTREYNVEGYADRVTLKRVNRQAPMQAGFEFLDRRVGGQGDYYYVRVIQQDDHVALSSPTFVGGFDPH